MIVTILLFCLVGTLADSKSTVGIIGGRNATEGEFPYIVSLQQKYKDKYYHFCGGSIVNEEWIVTAEHCTESVSVNDIKIYAGLVHFDDPDKQEAQVDRIVIHPQYNPNELYSAHEIALLHLSTPLVFNDLVQPVQLPEQDEEVSIEQMADFAGWGAIYVNATNHERVYPDYLKAVEFPMIKYETCIEIIHQRMHVRFPDFNNTLVCAGDMFGKDGACNEDSGGPLTQDGVLIGLAYFTTANDCLSVGSINVFTKASSHVSWILEVTKGQNRSLI